MPRVDKRRDPPPPKPKPKLPGAGAGRAKAAPPPSTSPVARSLTPVEDGGELPGALALGSSPIAGPAAPPAAPFAPPERFSVGARGSSMLGKAGPIGEGRGPALLGAVADMSTEQWARLLESTPIKNLEGKVAELSRKATWFDSIREQIPGLPPEKQPVAREMLAGLEAVAASGGPPEGSSYQDVLDERFPGWREDPDLAKVFGAAPGKPDKPDSPDAAPAGEADGKAPDRAEEAPLEDGGESAALPGWLSPAGRAALELMDEAQRAAFADLADGLPETSRSDLEKIAEKGLLSIEDRAGNTLLDYLAASRKLELLPEVKERGVTNGQVTRQLLGFLADPDRIAQSGENDCVLANYARDAADNRPIDFVKLNLALLTEGTGSGAAGSPALPAALQALQAGPGGGVPMNALKDVFPSRRDYGVATADERKRALGGIAWATMLGEEVPAVLDNPDGTAHMVTFTGLKGDRLGFYDPASPGDVETMDVSEFLRIARGTFMPEDLTLDLAGIRAMDDTRVGRRYGSRRALV